MFLSSIFSESPSLYQMSPLLHNSHPTKNIVTQHTHHQSLQTTRIRKHQKQPNIVEVKTTIIAPSQTTCKKQTHTNTNKMPHKKKVTKVLFPIAINCQKFITFWLLTIHQVHPTRASSKTLISGHTVDRCTTSYLLAGPVCLWCLVLKSILITFSRYERNLYT